MGSSNMAMLAPMWILMALWLAFVAVSGVFGLSEVAEDNRCNQDTAVLPLGGSDHRICR